MNDDMVERVIVMVTREIGRLGWGWKYRPFSDEAVPPHLHAALAGMIEVAKDTVWAERRS
jgi:hypothetical protein